MFFPKKTWFREDFWRALGYALITLETKYIIYDSASDLLILSGTSSL